MPRNLDSTIQDALAQTKILTADLIEIHFDAAVYFTNANIDIRYDSPTAPDTGTNVYLAQGQFLEFGNVKESGSITVNTLDISFTAVDLTTVGLVLNNNYIDKRVVLYRCIFDTTGKFNSTKVFQFFDGRITAWKIAEAQETATITIQCASQFADFEKTAGRTTSVASQQLFFNNDKGMEFSNQIVKDIKWGRE
jgi:hypothetical protein